MRLIMIEKSALTAAQSDLVARRLADPAHLHDEGPRLVWNFYQNGMLAFFDESSGQLVALVEASGLDESDRGGG